MVTTTRRQFTDALKFEAARFSGESGRQVAHVAQGLGISDNVLIPMRRGFLYLFAVLDWACRRVLAWWHSNILTTDFCLDAVREAITQYGYPEILNTDQGCQFTGREFTGP